MPYTINIETGDLEINKGAAATGGITQITSDAGVAMPLAGNVNILSGPGLNTSAAVDTETISLDIPVLVSSGGTGATLFPTDGVVVSGTLGTTPLDAIQLLDGEILIGRSGLPPIRGMLTAGVGIAISSTAGNITIAAMTGGFLWSRVIGTSASLVKNNGYISTNAALTTFHLPVSAAIGDVFQIAGEGTGLWLVQPNAGQIIHIDGLSSTPGLAGNVFATNRRDVIELVCTATNNEFVAVDFIGNIGVT